MSDLTVESWAAACLAKLHQYERECTDIELFCVGYLIPQVELLEVQMAGQMAIESQWQAWFTGFVDDSLQADGLNDDDIGRIQKILDHVFAH